MMSEFLSPESKISTVLNTIGDLIILNLLTVLLSIPIVTFGAAFSSMYQIVLKIVRKEEGHIVSSYFKAFRENFKKSTAIWLIGSGISLFIYFDIFLLRHYNSSPARIYGGILFVLMLFILTFLYFSLVTACYFENTLKNTIVNGVKFCVIHILVSILLMMLTIAPFMGLYVSYRIIPLILILGFSGPAFICGIYFVDLFRKYEPRKKGTETNTGLLDDNAAK